MSRNAEMFINYTLTPSHPNYNKLLDLQNKISEIKDENDVLISRIENLEHRDYMGSNEIIGLVNKCTVLETIDLSKLDIKRDKRSFKIIDFGIVSSLFKGKHVVVDIYEYNHTNAMKSDKELLREMEETYNEIRKENNDYRMKYERLRMKQKEMKNEKKKLTDYYTVYYLFYYNIIIK